MKEDGSEPDVVDVLAAWMQDKGLQRAEKEIDPTAAIVAQAKKLNLELRPTPVPAGPHGTPMMGWLVFSPAGARVPSLVGMLLTAERKVQLLRVAPVVRA